MSDNEDVSELVERLSDVIQESRDFARVAYGYDFDQARRNIPLEATGLEIDRLKAPYALEFLGLEPLAGDPTIEDMERMSADDYLPEPEEIEEAVNEVILDAEKLNDAARAVLAARVDGGVAPTRAETPWTTKLWVYDFRANLYFTLKQKPLRRSDLDGFVDLYKTGNRDAREDCGEDSRWRSFAYNELLARDKVNLDITWLRDESLEDLDNLPAPEIIAREIVEDLDCGTRGVRGGCCGP